MLLELKNISAGYNDTKIIHDVSLGIDQGEIVALMGPNGAGKSTILKSIFGLIGHEGGIFYEGEKIYPARQKLEEMGVIFDPKGRKVINNLTVKKKPLPSLRACAVRG